MVGQQIPLVQDMYIHCTILKIPGQLDIKIMNILFHIMWKLVQSGM